MRLTDSLREEHLVIGRALDALEGMVRAVRGGAAVPLVPLAQFVAFCRSFADGLHHQKEEELLFPALQRAGLPRESGPIGCMLREHDMGRALVGRLHSIATGGPGSERPATPDEFLRDAGLYISLLRAHIQKENEVLFVMAEQVMGDEENTRLLAALHLDETRTRRERDASIAEALAAVWAPPSTACE
jgi:hemerythrin-like domain-containing protein